MTMASTMYVPEKGVEDTGPEAVWGRKEASAARREEKVVWKGLC